jgi:large subunit ribosomal protein L32
MALPKRRTSKARKNKRRSVWMQKAAPGLVQCPQCHELKRPHRVCPVCGYYKGKEAIAVVNK